MRVPVVIVELVEKATRRVQTADPRLPRLRQASWRPSLLVARLARARLRRVLLALVAWQSVRLARAFFAPGRQL
jgi:hypothetical protein